MAAESTAEVLDQLDASTGRPLVDVIRDEAEQKVDQVRAASEAPAVPVPGLASALAHYDRVRAERLRRHLVQGLRHLFGAHTYARVDREGTFHTEWSGDRSERAL